MTRIDRGEMAQLGLLAGLFAGAAWSWPGLPPRVPIHWNLAGKVDGYGGRFEGALLLPLVATGVYLLLRFAPRFDPGRANYASFAGAYAFLRVAVMVFLSVLYAVIQLELHGRGPGAARVAPVLAGALLVSVGAVLGKVRPNWFVGIRTPWTLASKTAWTRTHRLGGWLFVAAGFGLLTSGVVDAAWGAWLILPAIAVVTIVPIAYSYWVWRQDPDKLPPSGTAPAEDGAVPRPR